MTLTDELKILDDKIQARHKLSVLKKINLSILLWVQFLADNVEKKTNTNKVNIKKRNKTKN